MTETLTNVSSISVSEVDLLEGMILTFFDMFFAKQSSNPLLIAFKKISADIPFMVFHSL